MEGIKIVKDNIIQIGRWEAAALIINGLTVRLFLNYPRNLTENSGTAGWIQAIYVALLAFLAFFIIEKLYSKFEGKDIMDISEQAGGNIGRVIVGIIIIIQLLGIGSIILREYSENMKVVALVSSPISYVAVFFLIGAIVAAYAGLEAIVRFHAITVPIVIIGYLFIIIAVMPYFDSTNFYPILGGGADKIFVKGFFGLSMYSPVQNLFFIAPFIKRHKDFKAVGYLGLSISAFLLISSAVVYIGVFPYPITNDYFLPTYQLSRMINFGRFFQRVESVFFLSWSATALMFISMIIYFLTYIFKKTFKLEYSKPLILPFAALAFMLSLLPPSLMDTIGLETRYYPYFGWAATFLMTIIVLLMAGVSKRRTRGGSTDNE